MAERLGKKIERTQPLNVSTSVIDCQNAFPSRGILKNGRPRSGSPICYLLVNLLLIKTITKFSNVIGYHQSDLNTNGTVYASCFLLDSAIGQLKGQLTRHAFVSGQNAS